MEKNSQPMDDSAEIWGHEEFQFQGQRPDESVMLLIRQHWAVLLKPLLIALVTLVVPIGIFALISGMAMIWGLVIYVVVMAVWLGRVIYSFMSTMSILTNHRLLDVTQKGFFMRSINEAELSRIQDVSSEVKGVLQTTFHFGQVIIRTASKDSALVIENIADPYQVQQAIVRSLKDLGSVK